jgi:hypothetical protein
MLCDMTMIAALHIFSALNAARISTSKSQQQSRFDGKAVDGA